MAILTIFVVLSIGCLVHVESVTPTWPAGWGMTTPPGGSQWTGWMSTAWPMQNSVLTVNCQDEGLVMPNVEYSFQDVCGSDGSVYLNQAGPWTVNAKLYDNGVEVSNCQYTAMNAGDITSEFDDGCTLSTSDVTFDGRDAVFSLEVSDGSLMTLESHNTTRRMVADFSGRDLGFVGDYGPWLAESSDKRIEIGESSCMLSSWAQPSWFTDLTVDAASDLPQPMPAGSTGYFMAAYVEPTSAGWEKDVVSRKVIGKPRKWSSAIELKTAWDDIKTDMFSSDMEIFGVGRLVIDLDVFGTAWNQDNMLNDKLYINYTSTCVKPMMYKPTCKTVLNPWTTEQAGVIADDTQFSELYLVHGETYLFDRPIEELKGYSKLDVLQNYAVNTEGYHNCMSNSDTDDLLKENIQSVEIPNDPEDATFSNYNLENALSDAEQLANNPMDSTIVMDNMYTLMMAVSQYSGMMDDNIAFTALNLTYYLASQPSDYREMVAEGEYYATACNLTYTLMHAHYYMYDSNAYYKAIAVDLSKLLVLSKWTGLTTTGFKHMLATITTYYQNGMSMHDFVYNELYAKAQWRGLIKRIAVACHAHYFDPASLSSFMDSKEVICKTMAARSVTQDNWRIFGLYDVREYLKNQGHDQYQGLNTDVLQPAAGVTDLFHWEENEAGIQELYVGTVLLDKMSIAWTKKAVCTCEDCQGGSTGSTWYPTGYSHGWTPGSSTWSPPAYPTTDWSSFVKRK